jgi:hypothetical protein
MALYPQLLQMLQGEANIADTQQQTQQRIMSILEQKQRIKAEDATRDYLSKISPMADASKQVAGDQATDDPLAAMQKNIQKLRSDATQFRTTANGLRSTGGDLGTANDFDKRAYEADKEARATSLELMREQKQRTADMGSLAGSVNDAESLAAALPEIRKLNPTFGMKGNFDRNPEGEITWGPKTAASMKAIDNASKSAADRIREQTAKMASEDRAASLAERTAKDREMLALRSSMIAQMQSLGGLNRDIKQAQLDKINAEIEDRRKQTEMRDKKITVAKAKAASDKVGPNERRTAADTIRTYDSPKFVDPETNTAKAWDADSFDSFTNAVAHKANQIYATNLQTDPEYSKDQAYGEAIDSLAPFVREQKKPGLLSMGTQLVYRRGTDSEGKVRESEKATSVPAGVTSVTPKTADEYLKTIGISK